MTANSTPNQETYNDFGHKRRKLERKVLSQPVLVRDALTKEQLGELINITTEGIMILAYSELACQSVFMFDLQLPEPIDGDANIQIGVDCLWRKNADNFERFWTGFQIIDADENTTHRIETLIANFG